jgi:hypothetical protein
MLNSAAASSAPERIKTSPRGSFFFVAHLTLLVVVLLGFSPTFYLRAFFHHANSLPTALYWHGAVLTGWFSLTVFQAWLIRARHFQFHRQLGFIALGYGALVIGFGLVAILRLISEIDSPDDGENIVVWGNFFTLAMFAIFVGLAVVLRKNSDAHKRLILLASFSIVGPSLARLPRWPIFASGEDAGRNVGIAGLLILFSSLIAYDLIVRKKLHPASWAGMLAILASLGVAVYLGVTGTGYSLLH